MEVDLKPVKSLPLSIYEEKDVEQIATLSEDAREVVRQKSVIQLKEGGIRVDPVFMTRQLCDIGPTPWQAHEFARSVLGHFCKKDISCFSGKSRLFHTRYYSCLNAVIGSTRVARRAGR